MLTPQMVYFIIFFIKMFMLYSPLNNLETVQIILTELKLLEIVCISIWRFPNITNSYVCCKYICKHRNSIFITGCTHIILLVCVLQVLDFFFISIVHGAEQPQSTYLFNVMRKLYKFMYHMTLDYLGRNGDSTFSIFFSICIYSLLECDRINTI